MPLDEDYGPENLTLTCAMLVTLLLMLDIVLIFLDWRETCRFMHGCTIPQGIRRWHRGEGWAGTLCQMGSP